MIYCTAQVAHSNGADLAGPAAILDAFALLPDISDALQQLRQQAPDASAFLQPNAPVSDTARRAAKLLFSHMAEAFDSTLSSHAASAEASTSGRSSKQQPAAAAAAGSGLPLATLHVDDHFDVEQIWMQLEMQSEPLLKRVKRLMKKIGPEPAIVTPEVEKQIDGLLEGGPGDDEDMSDGKCALFLERWRLQERMYVWAGR